MIMSIHAKKKKKSIWQYQTLIHDKKFQKPEMEIISST